MPPYLPMDSPLSRIMSQHLKTYRLAAPSIPQTPSQTCFSHASCHSQHLEHTGAQHRLAFINQSCSQTSHEASASPDPHRSETQVGIYTSTSTTDTHTSVSQAGTTHKFALSWFSYIKIPGRHYAVIAHRHVVICMPGCHGSQAHGTRRPGYQASHAQAHKETHKLTHTHKYTHTHTHTSHHITAVFGHAQPGLGWHC